ncbi:hypothetical protein [Haloferula sargassicola]|uniref:Uncharacterized protein n=1 Tax=Haloferula sargassicola TaxID=490096 RepID=A0ABP9UQD0_9BACT
MPLLRPVTLLFLLGFLVLMTNRLLSGEQAEPVSSPVVRVPASLPVEIIDAGGQSQFKQVPIQE